MKFYTHLQETVVLYSIGGNSNFKNGIYGSKCKQTFVCPLKIFGAEIHLLLNY